MLLLLFNFMTHFCKQRKLVEINLIDQFIVVVIHTNIIVNLKLLLDFHQREILQGWPKVSPHLFFFFFFFSQNIKIQEKTNFINFKLNSSSKVIFFHCVSQIREKENWKKYIVKQLRIYFGSKWFLERPVLLPMILERIYVSYFVYISRHFANSFHLCCTTRRNIWGSYVHLLAPRQSLFFLLGVLFPVILSFSFPVQHACVPRR